MANDDQNIVTHDEHGLVLCVMIKKLADFSEASFRIRSHVMALHHSTKAARAQ
jgi:hypothetical protein